MKILMVLFLTVMAYGGEYYFNGDQKVDLKPIKSISRGVKQEQCFWRELGSEQHIFKDKLCLQDEIILGVSQKHIKDIAKAYGLTIKTKLGKAMFLVSALDRTKALQISNALHQDERIWYAHPNFSTRMKFRSATTPLKVNDVNASEAWHLKNTGDGYHYKMGADIKIEEAWTYHQGDDIAIGIIDDGVETRHPDVVYTDGYSIDRPAARDPEHKTTNTYHHGTKAASLMVAKANALGSIGIANQADLYVVNVEGSTKISDIVQAYTWLLSKNVHVITNSWGTYSVPEPVKKAIENALKSGRGGKGTPVVFAVGNDNMSLDTVGINDESEIDGVIAVGASTPYDNRYILSNYGKSLTLVAPGVDMLVATQDPVVKANTYTRATGTSLAAPVVAGVVALMIGANKALTPQVIKQILQDTADKVATNQYSYNAMGRNDYYGHGRVNAADAVRTAYYWVAADEKKDKAFKLKLNRGWNLSAVPVKKVIHAKDFSKYFGTGFRLYKLDEGMQNAYVKTLYPEEGFFIYSPTGRQVNFLGQDYNATFKKFTLDDGWNIIGFGLEGNITTVKTQLNDIFQMRFYRNGKYSYAGNDDKIHRGEGVLVYKTRR